MSSSQDKNLPATARKLQKARDDGQAARSRDLSHLAVLGVGAVSVLVLGRPLVEALQFALAQQLHFNAEAVMAHQSMFTRMRDMVVVGAVASLVFALFTSVAVVASSIASGGWIYSFKPITPQFNRLNPLSGAANLFSKQQLINVVKMVFMTALLTLVAWKYFSSGIEKVMVALLQPSKLAISLIADWLTMGMALLLLVIFLVAVVDVPLQMFLFKSRLKMSHEEVKQEHKDSDGNPQIKGKIRQKQREIADRASVAAVPKADFVVMNPTHYAVALRYDDQSMNAPLSLIHI